jgi:hypothetical protein
VDRIPGQQRTVQGHQHVEPANVGAGDGAVVLDIGDGIGALVLHTTAALVGAEIEISPDGHDQDRRHVAVLARPGGSGIYAAVYPDLPFGTWNLWHPVTNRIALTVTVADGRITEADWPAAP